MESKISKTVIKFLGEKVKTRYVVNSNDFFNIINDMGLKDDTDILYEIFEYFEENKIDLNFETKDENYRVYNQILSRHELMRKLKLNRKKVVDIINLANEKMVDKNKHKWMEFFRLDDEDEGNNESKIKETTLTASVNNRAISVMNSNNHNAISVTVAQPNYSTIINTRI